MVAEDAEAESRRAPCPITVSLHLSGGAAAVGDVKAALQIAPTEIWLRPAIVPEFIDEAEWRLIRHFDDCGTTDEAVLALLAPIEQHVDTIRGAALERELSVAVICGLHSGQPQPVIALSCEAIRLLSRLGAEFSVDVGQ